MTSMGILLAVFSVAAYLGIGFLLEPWFVRWQERDLSLLGMGSLDADPGFTVRLILAWPLSLPVCSLFLAVEALAKHRASR